jgi:hypothetical protein
MRRGEGSRAEGEKRAVGGEESMERERVSVCVYVYV